MMQRIWWSVQRFFGFGEQGQIVRLAQEARKIEKACATDQRIPRWRRPSFSAYATEQDKEAESRERALISLLTWRGDAPIGRVARVLLEQGWTG